MTQHASDGKIRVFETSIGQLITREAHDVLGKGTYGVVYKAHLKSDLSVKKAVKTFSPETIEESEGIPSTTLREINALRSINHPNVMTVEEVVFPTGSSPKDMVLVMELCRGTLKDKVADLIRKHLGNDKSWLRPSATARLPEAYVKQIKLTAWELLNALAVVHARGIMHRDLKPMNILWSYDDLLKLADFGLARFVRGNCETDSTVQPQTGEVQTMWYRAPEVLLGDEKYGLLVDDWSLGCVIAEMFRFKLGSSGRLDPFPLFNGRSDVGTLMMIFETLGTPQTSPKKPSQEYLFKLPYWCDNFPHWNTSTLRERVPLIDDLGFDLIDKLLRISPSERKAARFLLDHPWFDDIKTLTSRFVRWCKGSEKDYIRMLKVDKLPPPCPLNDKENDPSHKQHAVSQEQKRERSTRNAVVQNALKLDRQPPRSVAGKDFNASGTAGLASLLLPSSQQCRTGHSTVLGVSYECTRPSSRNADAENSRCKTQNKKLSSCNKISSSAISELAFKNIPTSTTEPVTTFEPPEKSSRTTKKLPVTRSRNKLPASTVVSQRLPVLPSDGRSRSPNRIKKTSTRQQLLSVISREKIEKTSRGTTEAKPTQRLRKAFD